MRDLRLLPWRRPRASAARAGAVDVIATCALPLSPARSLHSRKTADVLDGTGTADQGNPPLVSDSVCFLNLPLHSPRVYDRTSSCRAVRMHLTLGAAAAAQASLLVLQEVEKRSSSGVGLG